MTIHLVEMTIHLVEAMILPVAAKAKDPAKKKQKLRNCKAAQGSTVPFSARITAGQTCQSVPRSCFISFQLFHSPWMLQRA